MAIKTVDEAKDILLTVAVSDDVVEAIEFLAKHASKAFAPSSKQMYVINKMVEEKDTSIQEIKIELGLDNPMSDTLDKKDATKIIGHLKSL